MDEEKKNEILGEKYDTEEMEQHFARGKRQTAAHTQT